MIPVIVTVVTLPFLLDAIGVERYGVLALCWLILIYVGQADWGLGRATTHWVARLAIKDPRAVGDIVLSSLLTAVFVGTIMAILAALASWLFFARFLDVDPDIRIEALEAVWLIGAGALATSLGQVTYGALAGRNRFGAASLSMLTSNASAPILTLAAAYWVGLDLVTLMLATLIGRIAGVVLAAATVWYSELKGQAAKYRTRDARKLLKFGFWIMTASFTAPVLITIDRIVIGSKLGAAAVAAYTIPYQVLSRLQLVPQSLLNVLFPRFSVADHERARQAAFWHSIIISALFLPIVIGLTFVLEPLLTLWLGDQLDPRSISVGLALLCAFLFTSIGQTVVVFLQSQNDGKFVSALQLGEIVPYFLLLGYAATQAGLFGVAVIFLARRIVESVILVARARFGNWRFWSTQIPAVIGILLALQLQSQIEPLAERLIVGSLLALAGLGGAIFTAPRDLRAMLFARLRSTIGMA